MSISFLSRRAATKAASLQMFAISAPANPGVISASASGVTVGDSFKAFKWTLNISARPFKSGGSMPIWRSKRPGRNKAESSTSGRLVAAIRITPASVLNPSISTNN